MNPKEAKSGDYIRLLSPPADGIPPSEINIGRVKDSFLSNFYGVMADFGPGYRDLIFYSKDFEIVTDPAEIAAAKLIQEI